MAACGSQSIGCGPACFYAGSLRRYHGPTVGLSSTNIERCNRYFYYAWGGKEKDTGIVLEFWGGEVVFVCEGDQAFDQEGFLDEGVRAGVAGELFDVLVSREVDDRDMAGVGSGLERFDGGVAPYAGHFVIHE